MAGMIIDPFERHVALDLHGYGVAAARRVARQLVREAWENGFHRITLVHGAAAAQRESIAWGTGYGVIKWQLRGLFLRGKWRQYLYHGGSRKHRLDAGCMRLAVRPNPAPRQPAEWSPLPPENY